MNDPKHMTLEQWRLMLADQRPAIEACLAQGTPTWRPASDPRFDSLKFCTRCSKSQLVHEVFDPNATQLTLSSGLLQRPKK